MLLKFRKLFPVYIKIFFHFPTKMLQLIVCILLYWVSFYIWIKPHEVTQNNISTVIQVLNKSFLSLCLLCFLNPPKTRTRGTTGIESIIVLEVGWYDSESCELIHEQMSVLSAEVTGANWVTGSSWNQHPSGVWHLLSANESVLVWSPHM